MSSETVVNVYWWEAAAIFFTVLSMFSHGMKLKGNMTKLKRKRVDTLLTTVFSAASIVFGVYGLFNHKVSIIASVFSISISLLSIFMKRSKYIGNNDNIIKNR